MDFTYRPRLVDAELRNSLAFIGAVLIEGPRACGKTATGRQFAASSVGLDVDDDAIALSQIDPSLVLNGDTPRFIDEWQLVPAIWNRVRHAIDDRQEPGQFILAGSSVPSDDVTRHSGAGRVLRLRMRPMSLLESGGSTGAVSLSGLLDKAPPEFAQTSATLHDVVDAIVTGGWPAFSMLSPQQAQRALVSYLGDVSRVDVPRLDGGVRRDPDRIARLIASLARNVATEASVTALVADTGADDEPLDPNTVRSYLDSLQRIMVIEDQPAWAPHLRSRSTARKAAKRHFVDPSLAAAALRATPEKLLADPNFLGLLFESLVVRDLRIYSQSLDAVVRHYRDSSGTEVDAIVTRADGTWAAIEVKLGSSQADAAAASLHKFVSKVNTQKSGEPSALVVITAGEYAYTRNDGVHVVPITLLGP